MSEIINDTLSLSNKVFSLLSSKPGEKFTARQIAEWIFRHFKNECIDKRARSRATLTPLDTDDALIQQIVAEIGSQRPRMQKKYKEIKTTESRPRKYYYSTLNDAEEVSQLEAIVNQNTATEYNEHSLYPIFMAFLMDEFGIYSKRIDEKRSTNSYGKRGNHWLHPDIVGLEVLSSNWTNETIGCATRHGDKKSRLWSFELKLILNRSNVREHFFQAVSNSSWANIAYLVTSNLEGTDTEEELRMLSSLHGIGVITLDVDNPAESQIIIPAKERNTVDWDIVNRMVVENQDFCDYIKLVNKFYDGYITSSEWS